MHEAALVRRLLRQALDIAEEQHAQGIRRIVVRVGALGHGSPEHLQWYFGQQQQGTLCEHATLEIVTTDEPLDVVLDSIELVRRAPPPDE